MRMLIVVRQQQFQFLTFSANLAFFLYNDEWKSCSEKFLSFHEKRNGGKLKTMKVFLLLISHEITSRDVAHKL